MRLTHLPIRTLLAFLVLFVLACQSRSGTVGMLGAVNDESQAPDGVDSAAATPDTVTPSPSAIIPSGPSASTCVDHDGDGYGTGSCPADCDDADKTRFALLLARADADGDGVGAGAPTSICGTLTLPNGFVAPSGPTDCNDADRYAWISVLALFDRDGDGFAGGSSEVCTNGSLPFGSNPNAIAVKDCDDNNPAVYPGALEIVSNRVQEDCSATSEPQASNDTGVFVNNLALKSGEGSREVPFLTIAEGVAAAVERGVSTVFVAASTDGISQPYQVKETLALSVSLNGGFIVNTKGEWAFSESERAEIRAVQVAPVIDVLGKQPVAIAHITLSAEDSGLLPVIQHAVAAHLLLEDLTLSGDVITGKGLLGVQSSDPSARLTIHNSLIFVKNQSKEVVDDMTVIDVAGSALVADSKIGGNAFSGFSDTSIGILLQPKANALLLRTQVLAPSESHSNAVGVWVSASATLASTQSDIAGSKGSESGASSGVVVLGDAAFFGSKLSGGVATDPSASARVSSALDIRGGGLAEVVSSVIDCGTSGSDAKHDQANGVRMRTTASNTTSLTLVNSVVVGDPKRTPPTAIRSEGTVQVTAVNNIFVAGDAARPLVLSKMDASSISLVANAWDGGDSDIEFTAVSTAALNACAFASCKQARGQTDTKGIFFELARGLAYRNTKDSVAVDAGVDPRSVSLGAEVTVDWDLTERSIGKGFDLGPDER